MSRSRRVVVTGLGALTPLGVGVEASWAAVLAGKSGIHTIDHFDTTAYRVKICGTVKDFEVTRYLDAREAQKIDGFIQYGIAAAYEALADAGLVINEYNAHRCGVAIGSGIGGLTTIEHYGQVLQAHGPRKISPFLVPAAITNMAAGWVSIKHNLRGPNIATATACATGNHAIALAARLIASGDAEVMVAGGTEKGSSALGLASFAAVRALSTRNGQPEQASRPWDKARDGFVLGDGAGVLVLEEYQHARNRGATIYAELSGIGMSGDAYHTTAPRQDGAGAAQAMQAALDDAGLSPDQVSYINAHGTSTPIGDVAETRAIRTVFGRYADQLPVSSTKSMTGHLLGAAGAVEAVFSIKALTDAIAPPTINLDCPDVECDLDYIPGTARAMPMTHVMSNAFGFGGTNAVLLFSRV